MLAALTGFSFSNRTSLVNKYVLGCRQCRTHATNRQKPLGELQPIVSAPVPFYTIAIDFVLALPSETPKHSFWRLPNTYYTLNAMMTATCKWSRKILLIPGSTRYLAKDWAKVFLRMLLLIDWGVPTNIISDRDRKFISEF